MKNKIINFCVILCLGLGVSMISSEELFAQPEWKSATFQIKTWTEPAMGAPTEIKVWVKEGSFRSESDAMGTKAVTINKGDSILIYYPEQNNAIKMPLYEEKGEEKFKDPKSFVEVLEEEGAVKVGEESIGSYNCDVYEYEDTQSGTKVKSWVWKGKGFPIRVETISSGYRFYAEYKNIKLNERIPDSMFELPAGVAVQDMGEQMMQMQNQYGEEW